MTTRKIIGLLLIISLSVFSYRTFAGDCDFVDSLEEKKVPIKYAIVFPNDVFNRAIDNLKAYCCDNYSKDIKTCDSLDAVEDYPQSEFLYDHLIDIAFRRLDGFSGNYVYGLEPDIIGSEWRKIIIESSMSVTGDVAARIGNEYDKYRRLKWYQYNDNFLLDYNNIEKVSLADKYYLTCDIVKNLIDDDSLGREKSNDIYYDACRRLAYSRIQDENLYVKTVMISASNQLLRSSFDAYLLKYFVSEKLSLLKIKLVEFVNVFYTIYKQAPASKTCSK